jgi:phage-related protein
MYHRIGGVVTRVFNVFYYKDKNGKSLLIDYLRELNAKTDKDSRIKVKKIYDYIDYLREIGPGAKEPYAKHLEGDIWELRPLRDRILYAAWDGRSFILLHHFHKDTRKTPRREIEQAKRNLTDYRERSKDGE